MLEAERCGVKHQAAGGQNLPARILVVANVDLLADERVSCLGEMDPDLVGLARFEANRASCGRARPFKSEAQVPTSLWMALSTTSGFGSTRSAMNRYAS